MTNKTLITLEQIESSGSGYNNLHEQLTFGRFNSVKSGAAPTVYQEFIAAENQRIFQLQHVNYTVGDHSLQVHVNGQLMRVGADNDYVEKNSREIEFTFDLLPNDIVTMRVNGGTSGPLLYEQHKVARGTTSIRLVGSYEVGNHSLIVYVNGAFQTEGIDYIEGNSKTVQFTEPLEHEDLVVFRVEGLPSESVIYQNKTTEIFRDRQGRIVKQTESGEEGIHLVTEFIYDEDGFPLQMVLREAGFIRVRAYEWANGICISIKENVKEVV